MSAFGQNGSSWTSFQGTDGLSRRSVIDFCLCSADLLPSISSFVVGTCNDWSDYGPLALTLVPSSEDSLWRSMSTSSLSMATAQPVLSSNTALDRLLIHTLDAKLSPQQALQKLYGAVFCDTEAIIVTQMVLLYQMVLHLLPQELVFTLDPVALSMPHFVYQASR
jgi:hypothetical protein